MLKELYTAALGMLPQQTRLEVMSNNLANASTSGYKRDSVFERNMIDARAHFYNVKGDAEQDDPPHGSYTDFNNGAMENTENVLDVAIDGKGFFVLQDEEGKQFLSRNGNFRLSKDGNVVATDGKYLMGQEGILNVFSEYFTPSGNQDGARSVNIKINENGEMFANEMSVGNLLIADVENPNDLEKVSASTFIVAGDNAGLSYIAQDEVMVRQGWLESSNVDVVSEMVQMIELQRMFEAGSKVIHTNNATLENSIRLGKYY